ncbi:hypothetical protein H2O64_18115 [Kordia sp. YSTF-M3]|uniref:Uncharacterized protein n=1 Tax=Kordia aestuariivivens TaxID=2759037 RepID=A0ABR7QDU3_9FLAO|nr:hypothetical protein [Kordia aestuariivivens]MBC8756593.1 hypothetical protein [Kordia aestuariivivens]
MKKNKVQHGTLKLNKGRIADLQAGTIFGGEDRGGRNKATDNDCIDSVDCTVTLSTGVSNFVCPDPSNDTATY